MNSPCADGKMLFYSSHGFLSGVEVNNTRNTTKHLTNDVGFKCPALPCVWHTSIRKQIRQSIVCGRVGEGGYRVYPFSMLMHSVIGDAQHGEITWMSSSSVEGHRQLLQIDPAFISSPVAGCIYRLTGPERQRPTPVLLQHHDAPQRTTHCDSQHASTSHYNHYKAVFCFRFHY